MIDMSHLPDEKPFGFIKIIMILATAWELSVENFWVNTAVWIIRILTGIYCSIQIYEYFLSNYRYSQWAKGGYKKEDKDKYRQK